MILATLAESQKSRRKFCGGRIRAMATSALSPTPRDVSG
jgi:hypothetical protein